MSTSVISWHLFYKRSCLIGSWEFREIELQPSWRYIWQHRGCQGLTYPKGEWLPAADQKNKNWRTHAQGYQALLQAVSFGSSRGCCRAVCAPGPLPSEDPGKLKDDLFVTIPLYLYFEWEVGSRLIQSLLLNWNYKNKYSISQHLVALHILGKSLNGPMP